MARKFLNGIDAVGIQLINLRLENLGSDPGSPSGAGHAYYNTAAGGLKFYDGSVWRNPRARGDHTGTQTASTISDFASTAQSYTLNQFASPTADLSINSHKLTNLLDPTAAQDAATMNWVTGQVQSAAAGISSKDPVRVVSVANVAALTGVSTVIDGITAIAGNRVLLTAQSTASQNGVWVVNSGAWTRPTTEGAASELDPGALWLVLEGTTYAGTQWRMSTTGTIVVGTTNITVVQFSTATTITAGNGLLNTSGTFSVKLPASSGLTADGTGLYLDNTIAVKKFLASIGDGSSTTLTVTHNLGTRDTINKVYLATTPWNEVEVDVNRTTTNTTDFVFATAPTSNQYRAVIMA